MNLTCGDIEKKSLLDFPDGLGLSGDAVLLKRQFQELQDDFTHSLTIGQHYWNALEAIGGTILECLVDNWDGYGAKALNWLSCANAVRFSKMLPPTIPLPEIGIDTSGEITFEWCLGPRQVFIVTMGSNGEIIYAGLFGSNKTHGTEYLDDELPETVLTNIRRVFPRGTYLGTAQYGRP